MLYVSYLILCDILKSDDEEWFKGFHVLCESFTEDFDKSTDGHESILLHATGLVVDRHLEHLEQGPHDCVRDERRMFGLNFTQNALESTTKQI